MRVRPVTENEAVACSRDLNRGFTSRLIKMSSELPLKIQYQYAMVPLYSVATKGT